MSSWGRFSERYEPSEGMPLGNAKYVLHPQGERVTWGATKEPPVKHGRAEEAGKRLPGGLPTTVGPPDTEGAALPAGGMFVLGEDTVNCIARGDIVREGPRWEVRVSIPSGGTAAATN